MSKGIKIVLGVAAVATAAALAGALAWFDRPGERQIAKVSDPAPTKQDPAKAAEAYRIEREGRRLHRRHASKSELRKAEKKYLESLAVFRSLDHARGQTALLTDLYVLYLDMDERDKASECFEKLEHFRRTVKLPRTGNVLANMGHFYWRESAFDKAAEYYEQAVEAYERAGDAVFEGRTLYDLGEAYRELNQYAEASRCLERSFDIARRRGDVDAEIYTLASLGATQTAAANFPKAAEYLLRTIELTGSRGARDLLEGVHKNLKAIYGPWSKIDPENEQLKRVKLVLERAWDREALARQLSLAIKEGDIHKVSALLDSGADVNACDVGGELPLETATKGGSMTLVKLLLDRGADLEAKNGSGSTALEAAFEKALVFGHEEIARYFLDMGADVKTVSPSGRLPLACAVNCSPAFVQTLLERGADVNGRAVHGTTALLVCARTGAPETSRLLLDRGADVHARDERGWTALTEAVWNDHLQVATILLDRGADPNAADNLGWTALMQAAWKGRAEAVNLLIARGAAIHAKDASGKTAFMRAVEMGHRNVASVLLDKGADVNGAQPDGWTPVIAAVTRQDRDMVVFLRKRGATMTVAAAVLLGDDPEMQRLVREAATKSTQIADAPMALLIAARNGREDMVTFLLDQCPDIDIKDSCCDAALLSAIEEKSTGIAVALLKKGANPNAANDWQVTALHRAVIKGDLKLVRLLLEKGADVNVCTIGWHIAPLVSAARSANVEIVKALLEKGAGLNAGDNSDDLMRAAVISGNKEVLELLKARGLTPTNQTLPPQIRDNSTTTDTIKEKIP